MMKLTEKQHDEIMMELSAECEKPVRFMKDGVAFDIITGVPDKKGCSVINQRCYWHFKKSTAIKIAKWLECRAVFSE